MSAVRMHPRWRINVRADTIGSEVVLGHPVDDISLGGARLVGDAWEDEGTIVDVVLTFVDDGGAHVHLKAEVVRSEGDDMGLRFCELSEDQRWSLKKYVKAPSA